MFIDSHGHIDFDSFDKDRDAIIARALVAGVRTIIIPAIDGATMAKAAQIAGRYSHIWFAAGWHPSEAESFDRDALMRYIRHPKCVAIGEIGLDFYRDHTSPEVQKSVLREQLEIAWEFGLPTEIHVREAWPEARRIIDDFPEVRCDFHAFSGDEDDLEWLLERGDLAGVGGPVTFKNFKKQHLIEILPLRNLLTETDCPFLTPHPHRGKRNEPSFIPMIARKIAEIKGVDVVEVEHAVEKNTRAFFGVPLAFGDLDPKMSKDSLSQNFLIDKNIAAKIVDLAGSGELCIEIGAGNGELTELLSEKFTRIWAVEPDWSRHKAIHKASPEAMIIPRKAQDVDIESLCAFEDERAVIIGNLPYGDTSPIIFHVLDNRDCIEKGVFMVQKEVAERLCSKSGSKRYGIPSVLFSLFFEIRREFDVSPDCFLPVPNVDSTVISLLPIVDPPADNVDFLLLKKVVKSAFAHRRKTIRNSMRCLFGNLDLEKLLRAAGIDPTIRAERVNAEAYIELVRAIETEVGS